MHVLLSLSLFLHSSDLLYWPLSRVFVSSLCVVYYGYRIEYTCRYSSLSVFQLFYACVTLSLSFFTVLICYIGLSRDFLLVPCVLFIIVTV